MGPNSAPRHVDQGDYMRINIREWSFQPDFLLGKCDNPNNPNKKVAKVVVNIHPLLSYSFPMFIQEGASD